MGVIDVTATATDAGGHTTSVTVSATILTGGSTVVSTATPLILPTGTYQTQVERFLLPKDNGAYTDQDVKTIIAYYLTQSPPLRLDPLIALAQMCLETAYLSSAWAARPYCNPAGIGVTGVPGAGVNFGSWSASVPAHLGRLVAYATKPADRSPNQQAAVASALAWRPLPDALHGSAPTLQDLTGKWAVDPGYADKIAKIASAILAS